MSDVQRWQFHEWVMDADFAIARSSDVAPIRFTRQEQAVLAVLSRRPGQLVSREQLLDTLDPDCDGVGDRSVDFLVNRLRRKLRDDARRPRFIATRYGEGYVWLVKGRRVDQSFTLLRIDSVYGLAHLSNVEIGTAAVRTVATQLGERLHWRCVMPASLGLTPPLASADSEARLRIDLSVFDDATHLHIAASIRDGRSGEPLSSHAHHVPLECAVVGATEFSEAVVAKLWSLLLPEQRGDEAPTEQPLLLHAHEAGLLLARSPEYWLEVEPQIVKARQENPNDLRMGILWAANRYARLLSGCGNDGAETTRLFAEYEECIETDVLRAVPSLGDSPAYLLTAAMLLLTLLRDRLSVVEELIQRALWNGGSFAAVFSVQARLSLCRGDLAEAIAHLDRALEMAISGTEFHLYLLVLRLKALIADGNRAEADRLMQVLVGIKPATATAAGVGFQSADPEGTLNPLASQMLRKLGVRSVRQMLRQFFRLIVQPMRVREHRVRLMLGPVVHARRLFGDEVIDEEILRALPELANEARRSVVSAI